ncbi:MAG: (E)-4-hydroxy-3-methylbut-2-enyl-diphosphate synthase [Bacteroidales bacterium]|nr:(E)-4-hydroxy-3-methylbut-2-enyl-diphosphate synthase [Bacteroidales bacterium]
MLYKAREIEIGNIPLGGNNPVRIQSMCSTNTMDTFATVDQSIRMVEAGCEYVRITAPGVKDAENLYKIKNELHKKGYNNPLIADIHFNPKAAEVAAGIVEKVRINPGNYVDKRQTKAINYSQKEYDQELERIEERLFPLIEICKKKSTAMRIGINHGSLSDRIINRYGNTANGMLESAIEFIKICENFNYRNIVLSMKSSNIRVMLQATRLLVKKMIELRMDYPLHLGVTEAGSGEDGRIKSAIGIGSLLQQGIGDTIRVSLTEDPEFEIPVAKAIVKNYALNRTSNNSYYNSNNFFEHNSENYEYSKRKSISVRNIGGSNKAVLISNQKLLDEDYLFKNKKITENETKSSFPIFNTKEYLQKTNKAEFHFININLNQDLPLEESFIEKIKSDETAVLIAEANKNSGFEDFKTFFEKLNKENCQNAVILKKTYKNQNINELVIQSSVDFGSLLIEGFGDGIWINSDFDEKTVNLNQLALGILQACGSRISKAEYIACPSCGRTLFDIQKALEKIQNATKHLKGLKIAVMGCIVNGPGEMADADYGYVGAGPGKITLYKNKQIIKKNIEQEKAIEELIKLIEESEIEGIKGIREI